MSTNIYVGNLSYQISEEELENLFRDFGQVESAKIIRDRATGRSKGFGFVEMTDSGEAEDSIGELNGMMFKDRRLVVNEARPRREQGSDAPDNNYQNRY
jgi:RNA recognition motif-containing protein